MARRIGIAGGSGAGKSTLAAALCGALEAQGAGVRVLNADRYYLPGSDPAAPRFVSPTTGVAEFDCNHPDAIDWPRLTADLEAVSSDVVLVEGLFVLHQPALRERLHLRLFVDLADDLRALRRLLRNLGHGHDPAFIARYYAESARVGHGRFVGPSRAHADLILPGDADLARLTPLLVAAIRALPEEG